VADIFDTLLLLALPASGKSETRTYLTERSPAEFHMGPTVQLDDYPYVHLQICVDEALADLGHEQAFHMPDTEAGGRNGPFRDAREIAGLLHLINEDYDEILRGEAERPQNPGRRMLERLDAASQKVGLPSKLAAMSGDVRAQVERAIDGEARKLFSEKADACPASRAGQTIVIEFARGGPPGDTWPLPDGYGYRGSLPQLSRAILERSAILYIWVTPEESRRKNRARARPDGQGSILFHGTPEIVMRQEYSRCDMAWLIEQATLPGTIDVAAHGATFRVPVQRFDNRTDLTTFLREDPVTWKASDVEAIHGKLRGACDALWESWAAVRAGRG
jgi:hypothetical protein